MKSISELRKAHKGQTLSVIGRGASLARLMPYHIEPGPVIAINQAIEAVEELEFPNPLYSMQKDMVFTLDTRAILLLHEPESAKHAKVPGAYVWSNEKFKIDTDKPSTVSCVVIGKFWGCKQINFLCCDASIDGSLETYGAPPKTPKDYLLHKALVEEIAQREKIKINWVKI